MVAFQEDYYGPASQPMMSAQNTNTPAAPQNMPSAGGTASHWGILAWALVFEAVALLIPHIREWFG